MEEFEEDEIEYLNDEEIIKEDERRENGRKTNSN
jgi:hypothetical protein